MALIQRHWVSIFFFDLILPDHVYDLSIRRYINQNKKLHISMTIRYCRFGRENNRILAWSNMFSL
jgi:hypothetical protein